MNRFVYFLVVGLVFTVLQVGVAGAAEDCSQFPGTGAAKAECEAANAAADGGTPGMPATTGAPAVPPPMTGGMPPTTGGPPPMTGGMAPGTN